MNNCDREDGDAVEYWIEQVKQGDKEAYRPLIEMYRLPLYRYAYHLLRSREEAEDAVQEAFLLAYRHLDSYSKQVSFAAWLYKIAYRHCLNLLRKRKGLLARLHLFGREPVPADHDAALRVDELLRGLSREERQIVLLRVVEEMTYEEIAAILDCKAAAVRKRFERTRKKLSRWHAQGEEPSHGEEPWGTAAPER